MDSHRRTKERFLEAVELAGEERARFLADLRAHEPELAARVASLLEAHDGGGANVTRQLEEARGALLERLGRVAVRAGSRIGDYELLEEVGAGASGVVFRARQVSLDRTVAVKVLRGGPLATARQVEAFRAEAEAVARLDDPRIVAVYEVGTSEAGPFFSMKWVEGGSLEQECARRGRDPRRAVGLLTQVAAAVHHAHRRGILHCDLKPSNVLLDGQGTPCVADFGIARHVGEETAAGAPLAGTPAYMAPEQATPGGADLSVATDVWGLGAILYELLAGRPAFSGGPLEELLERVREDAPAPLGPSVPSDLALIVRTCLAKDPADRYASADALRADLERWLHHEPIAVRPVGNLERLRLWARRRPLVAGLSASVAVLAVLLAAGGVWGTLRLRAQVRRIAEAEATATARLRNALVAQARERRLGGAPDRRSRALDLIRQAAAIQTGPDLRDEAIACLALPEVSVEHSWPIVPPHTVVYGLDADLSHFAASSLEGELRIGRVADGEEVLRLPGFGPTAWVTAFSPDGDRLAVKYHGPTTGEDPTVVLWDLESGSELQRLPVLANGMAFHPRASLLVLGTESGELFELDARSGEVRRRLDLGGGLYRMAFDPEGERLALLRYPERTLTVFRWPDLEELFGLEGSSTLFDVAWSTDGSQLVVGAGDFRAHLFDTATWEELGTLSGHRAEVVRAAFSPVDELVATASWDGTTRLWDPVAREELLVLDANLRRFGRDGRLAYSQNERQGIWRVDPHGVRRVLHAHEGRGPRTLAFSPDGEVLASAGRDRVLFWDARDGARLAELPGTDLRRAFFLPDRRLVTVADAPGVELWETPGEREAWADHAWTPDLLVPGAHEWADATPDGRRLVALERGGPLRVLDLADPGAGPLVIEPFRRAHWPALDPSGRWLALGNWQSLDVKLRVWDLASGEPVADLAAEDGSLMASFDPSGRFLVSGSGPTYRVFRTGSWDEVRVLERPILAGRPPSRAAFGPGATLLVEDTPRAARLHDLASGTLLARFERPGDARMGCLAVDPVGRFLAIGFEDRRIELWDLDRVDAELAALGILTPPLGPRAGR